MRRETAERADKANPLNGLLTEIARPDHSPWAWLAPAYPRTEQGYGKAVRRNCIGQPTIAQGSAIEGIVFIWSRCATPLDITKKQLRIYAGCKTDRRGAINFQSEVGIGACMLTRNTVGMDEDVEDINAASGGFLVPETRISRGWRTPYRLTVVEREIF